MALLLAVTVSLAKICGICGGVFGEVVAALAGAGDLFQQVGVGVAADGDGGDGDPGRLHRRRPCPRKSPGDEMPSVSMITCLSRARRRHEHLVGPLHRRIHRRAAARFDAADLVADPALVARPTAFR